MSTPPPPPLPRPKRNREVGWISPALSAFVYPGAGQLSQKRWLAGGFYLLLFTAAIGILFFHVFSLLIYRIREALYHPLEGPVPSWRLIGLSALGTALVYALNLVDTWLAQRKRKPGTS